MKGLQQERLLAANGWQSFAELALQEAVKYAKTRKVFGRSLSKFQNTEFKLAEVASRLVAGRSMIDNLILAHCRGEDVNFEVACAKMYACDYVKEVVDICLQVHGGYGIISEFPISRMSLDARSASISAGSSEVMKLIVARGLFAEPKV
jgi:acyl-CoA dehydrogenase